MDPRSYPSSYIDGSSSSASFSTSFSETTPFSASEFGNLFQTPTSIDGGLNIENGVLNNIDANTNTFDGFNNLDNYNNLDGSEIVNQIDQIIKLTNGKDIVDRVSDAISISAVELSEKLNSFFHIDITTFF